MQDWLVDTGADVHAPGKSSWRGKKCYPLKPTSVKLRGVSGADFQAFGTCLVKGTSGKQPIELEGILEDAHSLDPDFAGYTFSISESLSWLGVRSRRLRLTTSILKREVQNSVPRFGSCALALDRQPRLPKRGKEKGNMPTNEEAVGAKCGSAAEEL